MNRRHPMGNKLKGIVSVLALAAVMGVHAASLSADDYLFEDEYIQPGGSLSSSCCTLDFVYSPFIFGGSYYMRYDGSGWTTLVDSNLYSGCCGGGTHSPQNGALDVDGRVVMQGDGNVVMYDSGWTPVWATHTENHSGAFLVAQDDSNLVVYTASAVPIWSIW
jgi:hypothetical protein